MKIKDKFGDFLSIEMYEDEVFFLVEENGFEYYLSFEKEDIKKS